MDGSFASGSLSALRRGNVDRILSVLQESGGMTQIELSDASHLSASTVSNIVRDLTAKNILETKSVRRNGRHALYVTFAKSKDMFVGISIGRLDLYIEIGDAGKHVLSTQHLPLPPRHQPDGTIVRTLELLKEMMESLDADIQDVKKITISLSTPVPFDTENASPQILVGWNASEIATRFEKGIGNTPLIENNSNMAALAELEALELTDTDTLFVHADYEVGGALYLNGKLYKGHFGIAGELGHIQVDPNGPVCTCGRRGCLNTVVSATHLADLLRPTRGDISFRSIITEARNGDVVCTRLLEDSAIAIADAVAPIASTFDCEAIVLGGKMTQSGENFFLSFSQEMRKNMFPAGFEREILLGAYGDAAAAHGAMLNSVAEANVEN